MTKKSTRTAQKGLFLLLLLAVLIAGTGIASAGIISINTTGLTGTVGTTIQVPVIVTGATDFSGYQLKLNTGNRDDATVLFNKTSTAGMKCNDTTGIILWAGYMSSKSVSGDQTLFLLDITPISGEEIPLTVSVTYSYEHYNPSKRVDTYTGGDTTLTMLRNYNITPSVTGNGTITPSDKTLVTEGESLTFDTAPDTGHYLADILVDDVSMGNDSASYTFENVDADHTITAVFAPNTYTITSSADNNGTISPAGDISVTHGDLQTFTIVPNDGYKIADVLVDGGSEGNVSTYTFENVDSDHTIEATFAEILYTVTATAGTGGSITPEGGQTYAPGETPEYTIRADPGYKITNVLIDGISVGTPAAYTFDSLAGDHTISAEFTVLTYNITAVAGANGSITPPGVTTVTYDGSQDYTIRADTGYEIADLTVDGTEITIAKSHTFTNVVGDHTISANFSKISYTVTVSGEIVNGTVDTDKTTAGYGDTVTLTNTPDSGYALKNYIVTTAGGTLVTVTDSTFTMPAENVEVSAEFILPVHTITAVAGANGSITPSGNVPVSNMSGKTFAIQANTGYEIADLTVDGDPVTIADTYTFTNVVTGHTISTNFSKIFYNVTVNKSIVNGSVTAAPLRAGYDDTVTLMATPNADYEFVRYIVTAESGNPVTVDGSTFIMPNEDVDVYAEFILPVRTITASAGTNGSITPVGSVSVNNMSSREFIITPDANYRIADLTVDGTPVENPETTYTFSNVVRDHTISANFSLITHTITASAGANGTIDPVGEITVVNASSRTFNITPATGYAIADLTVDGATQTIARNYTFMNVIGDHRISTNFSKIFYNVTISTGIVNGTVTTDKATAGYGDTVTMTNTPDKGYSFSRYIITNATDEIPVTGSTFIMPAENVNISAEFTALPVPVVRHPDTVTAGINVTMEADYPGAETYIWNISGSVITSRAAYIQTTFFTPGDQHITVNATNQSGTSLDTSFTLTVVPVKPEPDNRTPLNPENRDTNLFGNGQILLGIFDDTDADADNTTLVVTGNTTEEKKQTYESRLPLLHTIHSVLSVTFEGETTPDDPHTLNRMAILTIQTPVSAVTDPTAVRAYRALQNGDLELLRTEYQGQSGSNYLYLVYAPGFSDLIIAEETSSYTPPTPGPTPESYDNGGADDGLELLAQASAAKPATPTATPTPGTTQVTPTVSVTPTTPVVTASPTPTKTVPVGTETTVPQPTATQTPVPAAGLLLGMGAAALLLRRSR